MTRFSGKIAAVRRTDEFEELYRTHAPAAWRVAWVILRNPDDAADAVAEAFARLYTASVPAEADVRAYLLATVRNTSIDVLRKSRRVEMGAAVEDGAPGMEPPDPAVAGENRAYMAQAFAELPERWRSALWLIDVEELSTRDAGSILGVTPNTAAQLASRARGRVRQQFLQFHVANHVRPPCRTTVDLLGAHAAGTLPPVRRARVDAHLAGCRECSARRSELEDLRVALRGMPPPVPLALLDWHAPRSRGSFMAVLEQLQAAPSTVAAEVVAYASPVMSAAGERVVAAAAAAVLVAGMSVAALRGTAPPAPADPGEPAVVAVAAPAPGPAPAVGPGGGQPASGGPARPAGGAATSPATAPASAGRTGPAVGPGSSVAPAAPSLPHAMPPTVPGPSPLSAPVNVPAVGPAAAAVVPALAGATTPLVTGLAGGLAPLPPAGPPSPVAPLGGSVALPGVPAAAILPSPTVLSSPPTLPGAVPQVEGVLRSAPAAATPLTGALSPVPVVHGALPSLLTPPGSLPATIPPAGLPPLGLPPAQLPPAQLPPAQLPPAQLPPAQLPPAQLPAAQLPPATVPPATVPVAAPAPVGGAVSTVDNTVTSVLPGAPGVGATVGGAVGALGSAVPAPGGPLTN
ncbi:MAG: sigma-70 family RNA polymerase sigma factor [Acidimicrobiia bacterium]